MTTPCHRIEVTDPPSPRRWGGGTLLRPQERLVKEPIDRVYSARVSVHIAAAEFSNRELARALRYKAEAGFDVRLVTAQPPAAPTTGLTNVRINPAIDGTIVVFDGGSDRNGVYWGGNAVQLSMPIFEAFPITSRMPRKRTRFHSVPTGLPMPTCGWFMRTPFKRTRTTHTL